ncbi:MAG TPA: ribonuclease Z [Vicinamibacteria bacterium]|jgi:ribonuclease Z
MKSFFHPRLVNDRFDDPSVYVDIPWEHRAVLFDLGLNYHLPPKKLLKVTDALVTHAHMDHFIGFDHLLRLRLPHDRPLRLYGPDGITARVASKLAGYTWNVVDSYPFSLEVIEIVSDRLKHTRMDARDGFVAKPAGERGDGSDVKTVFRDELITVRAALLDHKIPCAAYSMTERLHVNINRDALDRAGLPRGEWLRCLKEKIRAGEPDESEIEVSGGRRLRLGELRHAVVSVNPGQKMVYVVDTAFNEENTRRILDLAEEADIFFCEAPFLDRDADRAKSTHHLTARQAGWLARRARVKRLEVFHFSPRYEREPEALLKEALEAFEGEDTPRGLVRTS